MLSLETCLGRIYSLRSVLKLARPPQTSKTDSEMIIRHRDGATGDARYGASRVRDPEQGPAVRRWVISRVRQPSGHPIPDHQR